LIFAGIFVGLGFLADWGIARIFHFKQRPFLDPLFLLNIDMQALIQVLIATWIMAPHRASPPSRVCRPGYARCLWAQLLDGNLMGVGL
jgi:hypothetical protein